VLFLAEPLLKICARYSHFDDWYSREIDLAVSIGISFPVPLNPLCSLWIFSAFSVLNSKKPNTEATENHREGDARPNMCARWNGENGRTWILGFCVRKSVSISAQPD
jgi:hypothetical protein